MRYVSLDLETTSLDPDRGQILEIAMVLEDTVSHGQAISPWLRSVEDLPFFHRIVKPNLSGQIVGDAIALHMNARLIEQIAKGGAHAFGAVDAAAHTWLDEVWHTSDGKIIVAAKNGAGFDVPWLKFHLPELADRFSHRVIDPGSVLIDWNKGAPPSMKDLFAGREPSHSALEDARDNIRALRRSYGGSK